MTRSFARSACMVGALLVGGCASTESPPLSVDGGSGGAGVTGSGGSTIDLGSPTGSGGDQGGSGGEPAEVAADVPPSSGSGGSSLPDPGSEGDGDRTIGPNYTRDPRLTDPAAPKGKTFNFAMNSAQSQIYKGVNGNYTRNVRVYVPSQYTPAKPAAFMVTQDAMGGQLTGVLDNLINKKMLPVIVVLFAPSGGGDSVGSERGLEYDTVSGLYAEYVMKEMLPAAITAAKAQGIDLKFTDDPEGHGTLGGSSGGAGSFSMAWWHPDYFRRVITYSGTYVTQVPANSPFPHGCWIYHDVDPYDPAKATGLIVQHCEPVGGFKGSSNPGPCDTPLTQAKCEAATGCQWNTKVNRPIRIWHQSSTPNDLGAGGAPSSYRNFDLANQRMALAFKQRGYHYHYDHALGAGHVDGNVVNQTIVEAMLYVWRGYPIE